MAVFVSFSDETSSGNHLGQYYWTGFVGPELDWEKYFSPAWQWRVLDGPPQIAYLHMTEIRSNAFRQEHGLSEKDAEGRIDEAFLTINSMGSIFPIGNGMNAGYFRQLFGDTTVVRQGTKQKAFSKMEPDFLSLIAYAVTVLAYVDAHYPNCEKVDFVIERNDRITHWIKEFHEQMPEGLEYAGRPKLRPLLGQLIPAGKERIPLQAADLLCWYTRRYQAKQLDSHELQRYALLATRAGFLYDLTNEELARIHVSKPKNEPYQ
jgi:hypothetical protein